MPPNVASVVNKCVNDSLVKWTDYTAYLDRVIRLSRKFALIYIIHVRSEAMQSASTQMYVYLSVGIFCRVRCSVEAAKRIDSFHLPVSLWPQHQFSLT